MKLSKVTSNGCITIPAELREKYKLTPGRRMKFEAAEDGIRIIPLATPEEIKANIGFLGTKGKLLKALMKEKLTSPALTEREGGSESKNHNTV